MYYAYAIKSLNHNYIYKGLTQNVSERLHRHNSGYEKTTKKYAPFILIYSKQFNTRSEAREHEQFLKSVSGRDFLKSIT